MMDQRENCVDEEYQFYVVEFLDNPNNLLPKYVCVPASWLGFRIKSTQTAYLKYPVEDPAITNKRVENKEHYSNDWTIYQIHMEYGTDFYKEAQNYINKIIGEKTKLQDIVQGGEDEIKTEDTIETTSNAVINETESKKVKHHKRKYLSKIPNKKTKLMRKAIKQYKTDKQSLTKASLGKKIYKHIDANTTYIKKHKAIIENNGNADSMNRSKTTPKPVSSESKENETISPFINESLNTVNNEGNLQHQSPISLIKTPTFGLDPTEVQNLYACFDKTKIMMKELEVACAKNSENTKEFVALLNEYTNSPNKNKAMKHVLENRCENNTATETKELNKDEDIAKNTHYRQKVDKHYQDENLVEEEADSHPSKLQNLLVLNDCELKSDEQDEEFKPLKRAKTKKCKLKCKWLIITKDMIPKEYHENNSRWTLKHKHKKPHLMPLTHGLGVYVDRDEFNAIRRISRCPKVFARHLLEEVFTKNAIGTCYMSGRMKNHMRYNLVLDQNAFNAMLMCVREQAKLKNWPFNLFKIKNSLGDKLRYERHKYVSRFHKK